MASKLSKFLGGLVGPADGGGGEPGGPATEYKGFDIRSDSQREGSQWRMGGIITKSCPQPRSRRYAPDLASGPRERAQAIP